MNVLQLHFKTNSLQPEFYSKKKNRTRLRQIFRFHVVTSLFRMFTVAHCMFLSRFCFDGICCFIRIGRASHKNHFRYDFKCSSFSVLVFVYNQSPSYLWIFIYLFVCCCYVFFSLRPNDKWLFSPVYYGKPGSGRSHSFFYIFFFYSLRGVCVCDKNVIIIVWKWTEVEKYWRKRIKQPSCRNYQKKIEFILFFFWSRLFDCNVTFHTSGVS